MYTVDQQDVQDKGEEYYQYDRLEMLPFMPQGVKRVLEVGCGAGQFGFAVKRSRGAEVWGVETVPGAAERAKGVLDRIIVGDIERDNLHLPENYFDCVVFNDVLEHLSYPWEVLNKLRSALREAGYVVASIPNMRYYPALKALILHKQWDYVSAGILDRTHLRFFTERSIPKLFYDSGYELLTIQGINSMQLSRKLRLVSKLMRGALDDIQFQQFACVARSIGRPSGVAFEGAHTNRKDPEHVRTSGPVRDELPCGTA